MNDFANETWCVVDNRWFLQLAQKLGESVGRVLYYSPYEEDLPHIDIGAVGHGYENIERCDDYWKVKNEVDVFIFPDVCHAGAQLELEKQGFPVWGSRDGEIYELSRAKWLDTLKDLGLPVAPHKRAVGLTELKKLIFNSNAPQWVKISKWRGTMETTKVNSWEQAQPFLDKIAVDFGPLAELVTFYVFEDIESIVELGGDFHSIDGRIAKRPLHGIEQKGSAYVSTFQDWNEFPEPVQETMEAFLPLLAKERYRNFLSMEILQTKDGEWFPIDPCCRAPNPALGTQLELYANLPHIIAAGARGEFVEPEEAYKFSVECALTVRNGNQWNIFDIPEKARQWCKIPKSCEVDGMVCATPRPYDSVGMLVGVGNTIMETVKHAQATAELVKNTPLQVCTDDLLHVLQAVEKEEKAGIEFTPQTLPAPATVIENA